MASVDRLKVPHWTALSTGSHQTSSNQPLPSFLTFFDALAILRMNRRKASLRFLWLRSFNWLLCLPLIARHWQSPRWQAKNSLLWCTGPVIVSLWYTCATYDLWMDRQVTEGQRQCKGTDKIAPTVPLCLLFIETVQTDHITSLHITLHGTTSHQVVSFLSSRLHLSHLIRKIPCLSVMFTANRQIFPDQWCTSVQTGVDTVCDLSRK